LVNELGEPDYVSEWELGDGSTAVGNEFIMGRSVIDRYCVTFDHGGKVIVER